MSMNDDTLNRISQEAQRLWREHYEGRIRALESVLKVGSENEAALRSAIQRLRDETDPVIAAAERLTQDALGDGHLWAATRPLREALKRCPTRLDANGNLWRTGGDG